MAFFLSVSNLSLCTLLSGHVLEWAEAEAGRTRIIQDLLGFLPQMLPFTACPTKGTIPRVVFGFWLLLLSETFLRLICMGRCSSHQQTDLYRNILSFLWANGKPRAEQVSISLGTMKLFLKQPFALGGRGWDSCSFRLQHLIQCFFLMFTILMSR